MPLLLDSLEHHGRVTHEEREMSPGTENGLRTRNRPHDAPQAGERDNGIIAAVPEKNADISGEIMQVEPPVEVETRFQQQSPASARLEEHALVIAPENALYVAAPEQVFSQVGRPQKHAIECLRIVATVGNETGEEELRSHGITVAALQKQSAEPSQLLDVVQNVHGTNGSEHADNAHSVRCDIRSRQSKTPAAGGADDAERVDVQCIRKFQDVRSILGHRPELGR